MDERRDVTIAQGANTITQTLRGTWPALLAGIPALLTLAALTFSLFPWLEPSAPPAVRSVTITELALGERNTHLGDGKIANSVFFDVEIVGYDADDIAVDWVVYDARTRERLRERPDATRWGVIDIGTRSDRVVGEIHVPPPADHNGCVFVRVLLQAYLETAGTPASASSGTSLLLDVANTAPFDPHDAANPVCPDIMPSAPVTT